MTAVIHSVEEYQQDATLFPGSSTKPIPTLGPLYFTKFVVVVCTMLLGIDVWRTTCVFIIKQFMATG